MINVIIIPCDPDREFKDPYREAVSQFFKKLGFRIWCGSGFCANSGLDVKSVHPDNDNKSYCTKRFGSPDLWITSSSFNKENREDQFLVETKNNGDRLSKQQLDWLSVNGHLIETYIAIRTKKHPVIKQLQDANLLAGVSTKKVSGRK